MSNSSAKLVTALKARLSGPARNWWWLVAPLLVAECVGVNAWLRARALAELESGSKLGGVALRVEDAGGYWGTAELRDASVSLSPSVTGTAERVELSYWPWRRSIRVVAPKLKLGGGLDAVWEELHRVDWPASLQVDAAEVSYEEPGLGRLVLEGARHELISAGDRLSASVLRLGGLTFREVSLVATRSHKAVELRLGADPLHPHTPRLSFVPSPGEGVEWTLDVPSQPFVEFAGRAGFRADESFRNATIAAAGSLVVPQATALKPRASLRFVVDGWHRPNWPEAAVVTGASGAIALRFTPDNSRTRWVALAEVEAGIFSLAGPGELSLDENPRLTFHASGTRTCAQLVQHWAPSTYRERVRAHLAAGTTPPPPAEESVRLSLDVSLDLSREAPLDFRWHLETGCGLDELNEP